MAVGTILGWIAEAELESFDGVKGGVKALGVPP